MKKEKFSDKEIAQLDAILTDSVGQELSICIDKDSNPMGAVHRHDIWPVCLGIEGRESSNLVKFTVLPSLPPVWANSIKARGTIKDPDSDHTIFLNNNMKYIDWESCVAIIVDSGTLHVVIVPNPKFAIALVDNAVKNLIKIFDDSNDSRVYLRRFVVEMARFTEKIEKQSVIIHNHVLDDLVDSALISFTAGLMSASAQIFHDFKLECHGNAILPNVYLASSFFFNSPQHSGSTTSARFIPTELLHELEDLCGRLKVMDLGYKLKLAEYVQ